MRAVVHAAGRRDGHVGAIWPASSAHPAASAALCETRISATGTVGRSARAAAVSASAAAGRRWSAPPDRRGRCDRSPRYDARPLRACSGSVASARRVRPRPRPRSTATTRAPPSAAAAAASTAGPRASTIVLSPSSALPRATTPSRAAASAAAHRGAVQLGGVARPRSPPAGRRCRTAARTRRRPSRSASWPPASAPRPGCPELRRPACRAPRRTRGPGSRRGRRRRSSRSSWVSSTLCSAMIAAIGRIARSTVLAASARSSASHVPSAARRCAPARPTARSARRPASAG